MNELVKKETILPIPLADMDGDVKVGGKVSLRDMSVPYLSILQGLSPQVQPAASRYMKEARVSNLYLTVAEQVFEELLIVPCYFERVVNEWVPREKGGGLVATHDPEGGLLSKARRDEQNPGKLILPNGNLAVDTMYQYLLANVGSKGWVQCVYPMKSTAIKHGRSWNSNIMTLRIPNSSKPAPRWLYQWKMTSSPEQKADKIWYSPVFRQAEIVDRDTYATAREFAQIASTGMLRRPMEEERMSDEDSPI